MDAIILTYLILMFIGLYFLSFFVILIYKNNDKLFYSPSPDRNYSIGIVIPCYNEGSSILENVKRLLNQNYERLEKIVVVDDCSEDNSYDIIKKFSKTNTKVVAVQTPKNTGNAAGAKNYGAKFISSELIGFSDGDSYVSKNAIQRMVGYFNDKKMGAVTSFVPVRNSDENYLTKIQSLEYMFMGFYRKLLDFVNSVYVTNGPLSIYRNSYFKKIGGFDSNSITEDIEITWHMLYEGYSTAMALNARVSTIVPSKFKDWFNQRTRWGLGGLQAISKYKKMFFKKGLFGTFVLPFVTFSIILSIFTFLFSLYVVTQSIIINYLTAAKEVAYNAPLFNFANFQFHPSIILSYLIILLISSLMLYRYILNKTKYEYPSSMKRFFNTIFYLLVYGTLYPLVWFKSIYRYIVKDYKWR